MANINTGELRAWNSLTLEQQLSGEWIKVPDGTEGGMARPRRLLDEIFPSLARSDAQLREVFRANEQRGFDAVGKPRP